MKDYSDTDVPDGNEPPQIREEAPPDRRKVTMRQAMHLADLSGVAANTLVGRPIFELHEELKWKIDPQLLFMRKLCGRVVKKNPITGALEGVPNATVHLEDTDCSFLGLFPIEGPHKDYWWAWPQSCEREDLDTTRTDACGNFCVWIPFWDIDRIMRFRTERRCLPDVFRPNLRDLLERVTIPEVKPGPFPGDPNPPDPPFDRETLRQVGQHIGRPSIEILADVDAGFGDDVSAAKQLLDTPAFIDGLLPPLSGDVLKRAEQVLMPAMSMAAGDGAGAPDLARIDLSPSLALGPFLRCHDVVVQEWQNLIEIPDITFRVTQDVDSDGVEETIYGESLFDVRWNTGPIGPVTLIASSNALSTAVCEGPELSPCTGTAFIETVGLMKLVPQYHDMTTGYAVRPNGPAVAPDGLTLDPVPPAVSHAPYAGGLQLYGCHRIPGAVYYRMLLSDGVNNDVPLTNMPWWNPPTAVGVADPVVTAAVGGCDAQGWYPILPESLLAAAADGLLFNWETGYQADGRYEIKIELADAGKNPLTGPARYSNAVAFHIDNSGIAASISEIRWKASDGTWVETFTWPFTCIVLKRPPDKDIEFEVTWGATAKHLRNAGIGTGGCGNGLLELLPPTVFPAEVTPAARTQWSAQHRWTNVADNTVQRTTRFALAKEASQGSYHFGVSGASRAFNPAGNGGISDWVVDSPNQSLVSVALSIIDGPAA